MNDQLSLSVREDKSIPINNHYSLSQSLSDMSFVHTDGYMSDTGSSEDVSHSGAVDRIRKESCLIRRENVDDDDSSLIEDNIRDLPNDKEKVFEELLEIQRYSDQFKDENTHVFILSQSGKPIFSRYGNDSQTAALFGVMQAMVSFVETSGDKLRVVVAGNHNFYFHVKEHFILVAVSKSSFVPYQLRVFLNYLYNQILSILTFRSIAKAFEKQPGLDLRRLLVGTDRYLNGMIEYMEKDMGPLLSSVTCIPMQYTIRQMLLTSITQAIKVNIKKLINDLVFAILLLDEKLVGVVRRKDQQPHAMDLHLILNLIRNSSYFKTQINWLPICLPKFDVDGYFYAHISYLNSRVSLVLLTVNPDQFDVLQECQSSILTSMQNNGILDRMKSIYTVEELLQNYKLNEVKHFVYKMRNASQCISYMSSSCPESLTEKFILSHYFRLHSLIHKPDRSARLVYQCTENGIYFAWQTVNFELYATLSTINNKRKIMEIVNKLLDAIHRQKNRLFVLMSPTF